MPDSNILLTFLVATVAFAWIPGPAMLYTTARTIAEGKRAGWMAVLGIHVGGYVHVFAAALGLAILFQTIPVLYLTLKLGGAAYLCYLGARLLLSTEPLTTSIEKLDEKTPAAAFWQSATVEILNPKTAIFFIAFLPQFTDLSAALPIWGQLLILGVVVNIMFSIPDVVCVLLSARVMRFLSDSEKSNRFVQRAGGTLLIGIGLNLAASRQ